MVNKKALLRQIRNAYETTSDNIIGVGFGLKLVDGRRTDRESIVFFVREKKPRDQLKPEDVLPLSINIAGLEYPCDVVETPPFKALTACYDNNNQGEYEIARLQGQTNDGLLAPMRGGQEIFIFPGGWDAYGGSSLGTLGFFAIDNTDERVVGVTNTHVVIENLLYASDPVRLPDLTLPAEVVQYNPYNTIEPRPWPLTGDYYSAGCLVRDGIDYHHAGLHIKRYTPYSTQEYNYVDAALLIMNDGQFLGRGDYFVDANSHKIWQPSTLENPHPGYYPFATTLEIDNALNARCYSTGRTTGPKGYCNDVPQSILRITGVHVTTPVGFGGGVTPEFTELIQYQAQQGFETTWRASLGGDSGSALLADVNEFDPITNQPTGQIVRKIIGLVFAGNGLIGLANRIDRVAQMLNIRAWDESYQFTRSTSLSVPTPRLITEPVDISGEALTVVRGGQTYWHSGLTFQQYYVQWPPTDILLSNDSILETAFGGQLVGYFSVVDNDIWDNFVYALAEGEGDEDNATFRIIGDQLQVNLVGDPNLPPGTEDIYWRRVSLLLAANYLCDDGAGGFVDNSFTGKPVSIFGTAQLVNPVVIAAGGSTYPAGPTEEKWPNTAYCGFGFVAAGDNNYLAVGGNLTLREDFTIECWLWPTAYGSGSAAFIEGQNSSDDASKLCVYLNDNVFSQRGIYVTKGPNANSFGPQFVTTGITGFQARPTLPTNGWSHLAIVREEDTLRVYVNGVVYETGALTGEVRLQTPKLFGGSFVGYFSDLRVTTVARYSGSNFQPPSAPFVRQGPAIFDYETKNEYTIRVRVTDSGGNSFEKPFTIYVRDAIEYPPTDIIAVSIDDSPPVTVIYTDIGLNEPIWKFVTVDQDNDDAFTYDLVPGEGSTHNDFFRIGDVDRLYRNATLTANQTYSIRVRSTDLADLSYEKVFTIQVAEPPQRPFFTLQPDTTFENRQVNESGSLAGLLVVTSKDTNTAYDQITFELLDPTNNYPHNALFTVDNAHNDGTNSTTQGRLLSVVEITPAIFPNDPWFTVNIRATDTRTNRFTDQQFQIGRTFPEAPYFLDFTNAYAICNYGGKSQFAADELVTDLAIVYDSQSTFADIEAELVTTCTSYQLSNDLFTLVKNNAQSRFELKTAAAIDFNAGGYSNSQLNVCIKLTDTRVNLTNTSIGIFYLYDCTIDDGGGGGGGY